MRRGLEYGLASVAAVAAALGLAALTHPHRKPVPLAAPPAGHMAGLGSLHHAISTQNPEAQEFFDQGLRLDYCFNFAEAARAFLRAAQLDPAAPMPHWGAALARGPNYNSGMTIADAREASGAEQIAAAKARIAGASPEERALIAALAKRFSDNPETDRTQLERDYAAAMRGVYEQYPDDPDVAALYAESLMDEHAWDLWTSDGIPTENTSLIVAVLEQGVARWPDHLGLNHYYIHAMEASPHPERALASAEKLPGLAPASGHIAHMPAHIYVWTGDYDKAVRANQAALQIDAQYVAEKTIVNSSYISGYLDHNRWFLVVAAGMEGDATTALGAASELARTAPPDLDAYTTAYTLTLLRFGRWDAILDLPTPESNRLVGVFFWHFARGCALARLHRQDAARRELAGMAATYARIPDNSGVRMLGAWSELYPIAYRSLSARIAQSRGDHAEEITDWRAAVAFEDSMPYHEPMSWYPIRESLGAALLRAGQAAEAEKVFREDLGKNRLNPRSLFGVWQCLLADKKSAEAGRARRDFLAAWKGAPDALNLADL